MTRIDPDKVHKCAICGGAYTGYGHNAWPVKDYPNRCCDACNTIKVIPTRIHQMRSRFEAKPEEPAS